jgi:long-chain acyl-CoA synthetase
LEEAAVVELSATIPALLSQQVATYGSETILREKDRGIWNAVSWTALDEQVRRIGEGLRAAGLRSGEVVAVLSETRPEFVYTDLAILGCGAASLAISTDADGATVGAILRDTGAALAIVEGEEQLDKLLTVRADCPALRRIVIIDMKGLRDFRDDDCTSLAALIEGGGTSDWRAVTASVTPEQVAAIVVTRDGTRHDLTHAGILRQIDAIGEQLGLRAGDERLAVLPMCDPAERVLGLYVALKHRIVSDYLENPETATENLREVKPTVFGANTEAWERLHARIGGLAGNATFIQRRLYQWAVGSGEGPGGGPKRTLARMLVSRAVRAELGFGRLRVAFVGDRPLPPEILHWALALGITVRYLNPLTEGETHV